MAVDPWIWAIQSKINLASGEFGWKNHEYQVEPMQSNARRVVIRKSTQMGFTEAYVLRCLHRLITQRYKMGILYLFPTRDDVTDFSTSRFKPLLVDNYDAIGSYISDTDRANLKRINKSYIYFRSGRLGQTIEGQKTSSKLKSIPVDACVFDEWDEMDPGAQEMAISRMQHSPHQDEVYLANPTIPDYGIDKMYQLSDQRVWMLTCEKCGTETCLELEFPQCLERRGQDVVRVCRKCGGIILPSAGKWVAQYPGKDIAGYWISHLNSMYVAPRDLLDQWETDGLDKSNFYRLKLGMPYIGATDRLSKNDVLACCGQDLVELRSSAPCALGIDVGSTLHVVVLTKPSEDQRKMIFCGSFKEFEDVYDTVRNFNIQACVIDKYPETRKAREWGKSMSFQTFLCEYRESTHGFAKWDEKGLEIAVNRTELCDQTHDLVSTAGKFTIPRRSEEINNYAVQMTNTAKILKTDPQSGVSKYLYIKLNSEDHYRHATNYAWLASLRISSNVRKKKPRRIVSYSPFDAVVGY